MSSKSSPHAHEGREGSASPVSAGGALRVSAAGAARLLSQNGTLENARQHMRFPERRAPLEAAAPCTAQALAAGNPALPEGWSESAFRLALQAAREANVVRTGALAKAPDEQRLRVALAAYLVAARKP